jgi:hypothetical protein
LNYPTITTADAPTDARLLEPVRGAPAVVDRKFAPLIKIGDRVGMSLEDACDLLGLPDDADLTAATITPADPEPAPLIHQPSRSEEDGRNYGDETG